MVVANSSPFSDNQIRIIVHWFVSSGNKLVDVDGRSLEHCRLPMEDMIGGRDGSLTVPGNVGGTAQVSQDWSWFE